MLKTLRNRISLFLSDSRDYPVLTGITAGVYPLLFFYSNNFYANNSLPQFLFYTGAAVLLPTFTLYVTYLLFLKSNHLAGYKSHLVFVALITITWTFISMAMYMTLKKKILLGVIILACLISLKLHTYYKHLILILTLAAAIPAFKVIISSYDYLKGAAWAETDQKILAAKFITTPNIYMIQPDGYVSKPTLENPTYSSKTGFYSWLEGNGFTVYNDFHSNYPGSLSSNASLFAMKQHYFANMLFPAIEMPHAREVVMANNAIRIFKNNNYHTSYIAEYEYFQQNRSESLFDYHNIPLDEVPYFTNGVSVRKDVYEGLADAMDDETNKPKFYFVEKILPHHIYFTVPGRKKAERKNYLEKVDKANDWLKKTINMINAKDPNAIIILLADHGGYVGMESFDQFYSTNDRSLIQSTFGNLAAIKWNAVAREGYDKDLRSNVNVFRVLFAALSRDRSHLENMEEDGSYNIRNESYFSQSVYQLIDDDGHITSKKH